LMTFNLIAKKIQMGKKASQKEAPPFTMKEFPGLGW